MKKMEKIFEFRQGFFYFVNKTIKPLFMVNSTKTFPGEIASFPF